MAAAKIRKGDQVVVLSGKDKGRTGTVVRVMPKDGKVVVEGVNVAARVVVFSREAGNRPDPCGEVLGPGETTV